MVVVSALTSEAILGIDFLQAQQAMIDLGRGTLQLRQSGCDILLDAPTHTKSSIDTQQVCMSSTVEIPPRIVMTVCARFEKPVDGVWLVEDKQPHLAVGCAVVEPSSTDVPVCVLNVSDEPVTLYAGTVVASLQPVEVPTGANATDQGAIPGLLMGRDSCNGNWWKGAALTLVQATGTYFIVSCLNMLTSSPRRPQTSEERTKFATALTLALHHPSGNQLGASLFTAVRRSRRCWSRCWKRGSSNLRPVPGPHPLYWFVKKMAPCSSVSTIESLTKSPEKTLTPYRASMLPWTLSTVHIGLRFSTCLVATGRSRWRRLTRRRPPSVLRRASITSGLCPSGCVTPQPLSNGSWTSCCQGCSGPNA